MTVKPRCKGGGAQILSPKAGCFPVGKSVLCHRQLTKLEDFNEMKHTARTYLTQMNSTTV